MPTHQHNHQHSHQHSYQHINTSKYSITIPTPTRQHTNRTQRGIIIGWVGRYLYVLKRVRHRGIDKCLWLLEVKRHIGRGVGVGGCAGGQKIIMTRHIFCVTRIMYLCFLGIVFWCILCTRRPYDDSFDYDLYSFSLPQSIYGTVILVQLNDSAHDNIMFITMNESLVYWYRFWHDCSCLKRV
jgi:hypothetical protein